MVKVLTAWLCLLRMLSGMTLTVAREMGMSVRKLETCQQQDRPEPQHSEFQVNFPSVATPTLTLKTPITTAAEDIHKKTFSFFFREKKS